MLICIGDDMDCICCITYSSFHLLICTMRQFFLICSSHSIMNWIYSGITKGKLLILAIKLNYLVTTVEFVFHSQEKPFFSLE